MYGGFAAVYDTFMCPPYDEWAGFVRTLWRRYGEEPKLVLDLACGTGNMTARFAAMGYDMIGVDLAEDMLAEAKLKSPDILYICQDMREMELYGTVDAACCLCDGMSYLEGIDDLIQVFRLMANYLNPGGVFVFDINTAYYFAEILGDGVFAESSDSAAYIWENEYDPETRVNEYAVTFFVRAENGMFRRFEELHREYAFTDEDIRNAAAAAGLTVCGAFADMDFTPPSAMSERIFYAVRREKE